MYKEREGHCRVPSTHKENGFRLGGWVVRQRQSKDQETLSEARRQQLDELGFVWDPLQTDWEEGFRYLTIYKAREGHCRVPQRHKENGFRLGGWVNKQRHAQTLSEARRQRLDELSFVWDPFEADWEEGFKRLQAFAKEYKHCRVPWQYKSPDGYNLGTWVSNRRRRSSIVSPERKAQLAALGFDWKVVE
jgi:hypothetical protein